MESIQIFLKLDSLFKAKLNVRAKTIQFILNLDSSQKLMNNTFAGNIGFWCKRFQIQWIEWETAGILENWSQKRRGRLREVVAAGVSTAFRTVFSMFTKLALS